MNKKNREELTEYAKTQMRFYKRCLQSAQEKSKPKKEIKYYLSEIHRYKNMIKQLTKGNIK